MSRGVATVDGQRYPRDERAVVRCEEERGAGDLFGPAETPQLVLLACRLAHFGHRVRVVHRSKEWRVDEARTNRVGPDAEAAIVVRDVLREQHDRALGCVVGTAAFTPFESLDARHRD